MSQNAAPIRDAKSSFGQIVSILNRRYVSSITRGQSGPVAQSERVIVVVGAGFSLWSGLPLWKDAELLKAIIAAAEKHFAHPNDFIRHCWHYLSSAIGLEHSGWTDKIRREELLKRATLDMICAAASTYSPARQSIIDELRSQFSPWDEVGPPPQLGCELLAHLLKHRFIDDIITFNFDELLDVAIENEVPQCDYEFVTSDQQIVSGYEPDKSHLIKLHGTVTHPATLRFTPDRTHSLSAEMIALLDSIIFGAAETPTKVRSVSVLSLGYSWADTDFRNWLCARADHLSHLTVVTLRDREPRELLSDDQVAAKTSLLFADEISPGSPPPSIDMLLWAVWQRLESSLVAEHVPVMTVARHLILSYLFGPRDALESRPLDPLNRHTLERRFRVEVLLHALKCKGMVNLSVMARDCRLHRYHEVLIKGQRTELAKHRRHGAEGKDPMESLGFLERSVYPDVKETYFATVKASEQFAELLLDQKHFVRGQVLVPKFDDSGALELVPTGDEVFLREQVARVFAGPEVEVVRGRDRRHDWLFVSPTPLSTFLELQDETRNLLGKSWSHLLVVAESGAWLSEKWARQNLKEKKNGPVLCIETSQEALTQWHLYQVIRDDLRMRRETLLKETGCALYRGTLAWWKHNRHLTLAYDDATHSFVGGVYFRRRLKASQISPVAVKNDYDCAELLLTFLSYAKRVGEEIREEAKRGIAREPEELASFRRCAELACDVGERATVPSLLKDRVNLLVRWLRGFLKDNEPRRE